MAKKSLKERFAAARSSDLGINYKPYATDDGPRGVGITTYKPPAAKNPTAPGAAAGGVKPSAMERYTADRENKRQSLQQNTAARGLFDSISQMDKDLEMLPVLQQMRATTDGQQRAQPELDRMAQAYGFTMDELQYNYGGILEDLQRRRDQAQNAMANAGYDYDQAAEYAERLASLERNERNEERWAEYAREHPFAASAESVATSVAQGVDYLQQAVRGIGKSDPDDAENYVPYNTADMTNTNYVQTVRETVSEDMGPVASFLYNTGLSIAESSLLGAVLGPAALPIMGLRAAADGMKSAVEAGATNNQALAVGAAQGVAEALFEKLSIENLPLVKNAEPSKMVYAILKQMGIEGSEEMMTETANILSEAAILQEKSGYQQAMQAEMANGADEKTAKKNAFLAAVKQVGLSGLGGAISGGVMGGGAGALGRLGGGANPSVASGDSSLYTREPSGAAAPDVATGAVTQDDAGVQTAAVDRDSQVLMEAAMRARENAQEVSDNTFRTAWDTARAYGEGGVELQKVQQSAAAQVLSEEQLQAAYEDGVRSAERGAGSWARETARMGEAGGKALEQVRRESGAQADAKAVQAEYASYYRAGLAGADTGTLSTKTLTQAQQQAAYQAGRTDAAASLKQEQKAATQAQTAAAESGLVQDEYVKQAIQTGSVAAQNGVQLTRSTAQQLDRVARALGVKVQFVDQVRGGTANAEIRGSEVLVERGNDNPVRFVLGHEFTHRLQALAPAEYRAFRDAIYAETDAEAQVLMEQYGQQGVELRYEQALDEAAANYAGRLIEGGEVLDRFIEQHWDDRTLLQKVRDAIRAIVDKLTGADKKLAQSAEGKLSAALEAAAQQAQALEGKKNTASEGGKFSIHYDAQDVPFVVIDQNILDGVPQSQWVSTVKNNLAKKFPNGVKVGENTISINKQSRREMTFSKYMQRLFHTEPQMYEDKLRATDNADEIILAARNWVNEALLHPRKDDIIDFARGEVILRIGGRDYRAQVIVGNRGGKGLLLYDIINLKKTAIHERTKKVDTAYTANAQEGLRSRKAVSSNDSIRKDAADVKGGAEILHTDGVATNGNGDPVAAVYDNGSARLSLKTYQDGGRQYYESYLNKQVKAKKLTAEDAADMLKQLDAIFDVCQKFKGKYTPFGNWSDAKVVTDKSGNPVFSVIKKNGEYAMNLDFSLVCKKRRTLDGVLNAMVRDGLINQVMLDEAGIVRINDIIRSYDFETACALCFVDAKRFRQANVALQFAEIYNKTVESMIPKGSSLRAAWHNFGGNANLPKISNGIDTRPDSELDFRYIDEVLKAAPAKRANWNTEQKVADYLKRNPADRKIVDVGDFMSTAGFENAQVNKPEIMKLYNSKKGSGGPKAAFGDVQYLNDILKRSRTFNVKKAYTVGGVRVQSFSSYVPRMVFDYVQMMSELAAKQLPAHAYTKEPLFAMQFGKTGMKINLSLIPAVVEDGVAPGLNADGEYVWADESFPFETALDIQSADGYSQNCGTICVGVSDEHIRTLMADDRIRMVIPYHKSGLNHIVASMNKIDQFKDYTNEQNTRYAKDGTKLSEEDAKKEIGYNQRLISMGQNADPRAAAEAYVRWCESNDYLPKFDRFCYKTIDGEYVVDDEGNRAVDENYYKLLEDFAGYDGDEYAPQRAVRMEFPQDGDAFGSMEALIEQGLEEDAVLEARRTEKIPEIVEKIRATMTDGARQSLKGSEKAGEMAQLRKENAQLQKQVEYWRGQTKRTERVTTDEKAVRKTARELRKAYGSEAELDGVAEQLQELYDYIAAGEADGDELVWEGVQERAQGIAEMLVQTADGTEDLSLEFTDEDGFVDQQAVNAAEAAAAQIQNSAPAQMAKSEIANDIIERFFELPQTKATFADRKAMQMQERVAKEQKRVERVREQLREVRRKRDEKIEQMRTDYRDKNRSRSEKQKARELRAKITRHAKAMSQKLLRPTDGQHVPEGLRAAVAQVLEAINLESSFDVIRDEEGKIVQRIEKSADPETATKRTAAFRALRDQYAAILKDEGTEMIVDPSLFGSEAEGVKGLFASVTELENTPIGELNVQQLQDMWTLLRAVEHSITTAGKILSKAKFEGTQQWAEALRTDGNTRKDKHGLTKRHVGMDLETPYTYFSHYGESGLALYRMLRDAQDQQKLRQLDLKQAVEEIVKPEQVKELQQKRHSFETERGDELTLTTAHVMELRELLKRQQAQDHLLKGGIVQPAIERNGKQKEIRRGTDAILLTINDLMKITGELTAEEAKIADGLQGLMTGMLADLGNEASMKAYGYKKFTGADYWPIRAAKEAVHSTVEKGAGNTRSIKNIGLAQSVTPHASNALDLAGAFDTFARHSAEMLDYSTWLLPMEDANRVYNFEFRDGEGNRTGKTVKGTLDRIGGEGAQRYWSRLMEDIQNGTAEQGDSEMVKLAQKVIGNAKGAAVGANLRVVVQQPTAFFRAAAVLDPRDLTAGLAGGVTKGSGWEKALQWAPIAQIKDSGGFDVGAGSSMARELYGTQTGLERFNEAMGWAAGKADAVTWGKLWDACEHQVQRTSKLQPGSDAFYRATAKVFTEMIDQTQVVDGVLQRSQIMRSHNALNKQATAYMGEPTQSLNLLMRAADSFLYEQDHKKRSAALKRAGRAAAALVVTDVINALAQSLVDAIRDDEDEKYLERYVKALTGLTGDEEGFGEKLKAVLLGSNVADNMNLLGRIPYVKDVLSIAQGYDVIRADADVFADIINAGKTFADSLGGDGKKTMAYALEQLAKNAGKMFGISAGNILRDAWGIARSVAVETDNVAVEYAMEKAIYNLRNDSNTARFYDTAFKARELGDTEVYERIRQEMLDAGVTDEKKFDNAMLQRMKKSDAVAERKRAVQDEVGTALQGNSMYAGMDAEWQAKADDAANTYAEAMALLEMDDGYELNNANQWVQKARDGAEFGVEDYEYILFKVGMQEARAEDDSLTQADVIDILDGMDWLTDAERSYLFGTKYDSDKNNPYK